MKSVNGVTGILGHAEDEVQLLDSITAMETVLRQMKIEDCRRLLREEIRNSAATRSRAAENPVIIGAAHHYVGRDLEDLPRRT